MRIKPSVVLSPVAIIAVGSLLVAGTGTAIAATGGSFLLGRSNVETKTTKLTDKSGTPLSLVAGKGRAPLTVNSTTKVAHLNSDLLDGLDSSQFARALSHTVTVRSSGTALQNGAALIAANAEITKATYATPWLIQLEPGDYDLGSATLTMKSYVDITGSGEDNTFIVSTPTTQLAAAESAATIALADRTAISEVDIDATLPTGSSGAVSAVAFGGMDVSATLGNDDLETGGAGTSDEYGLDLHDSSATLNNVSIESGDTSGEADGIYSYAGDATIFNSQIEGYQGYSLGGPGNAGYYAVANTELIEPVNVTLQFACVDDYDASFAPYSCS